MKCLPDRLLAAEVCIGWNRREMIITISGDIGSGKSTTGKLLAKTLQYDYLSTGAIQRKIAEEMGLTTLELNILTEKMTEIDDRIDDYSRALNDSNERVVVDSRLAWHFIPKSYKIYLLCKEQTAAERILNDTNRLSDEASDSLDNWIQKIRERRDSERRRFKTKYGIDFSDLSQYDQVIDSTFFNPEELVSLIRAGMRFAGKIEE